MSAQTKQSTGGKPAGPLRIGSLLAAAVAVISVAGAITFVLWRMGCRAASPSFVFQGGLDPCVKESVQSGLAIAGILTVVGTAWGVLNELRKQQIARSDQARAEERENELRSEDLRWRQAQEAHRMLKEIHDHRWASAAVQMMDWSRTIRSYEIDGRATGPLSWSEIQSVVRNPPTAVAIARHQSKGADAGRSLDEQWKYDVVDAFDWFLYYLNRIAYALESRLVVEEDVLPTLHPYLERLDFGGPDSSEQSAANNRLHVATLVNEHCYAAIAPMAKDT